MSGTSAVEGAAAQRGGDGGRMPAIYLSHGAPPLAVRDDWPRRSRKPVLSLAYRSPNRDRGAIRINGRGRDIADSLRIWAASPI